MARSQPGSTTWTPNLRAICILWIIAMDFSCFGINWWSIQQLDNGCVCLIPPAPGWRTSPTTCALLSTPLCRPITRTWTWEERVLVRRGEAAGAIADMQSPRAREPEHRYTVYWKGELYVHCQNDSIMRITLSNGEYEVIKPPTSMDEFTEFYIGKSKKGLYCALIYKDRSYRLQVWLLSELRGKMEWGLKIDTSLVPVVAMFSWLSHEENSGPWILHGGNYDGDGKKVIVEDKCEWDFNNGILLEARDGDECDFVSGSIYFLGFHPYDEIAFLWVSRARVVAYHLSSSKVQDLGMLHVQCVGDSFPYTPYWTGELFEKH
ncbi:hypothetical protein VPH35_060323 [Triticum aestivum]